MSPTHPTYAEMAVMREDIAAERAALDALPPHGLTITPMQAFQKIRDIPATGTRPQHELSLAQHGLAAIRRAPTAAAACHRASIALEQHTWTAQEVADELGSWVRAHPAVTLNNLDTSRSAA